MENSGNILIFSDIYDTRSGRGCNVTLLTEDSQSLRDLADRAGIGRNSRKDIPVSHREEYCKAIMPCSAASSSTITCARTANSA